MCVHALAACVCAHVRASVRYTDVCTCVHGRVGCAVTSMCVRALGVGNTEISEAPPCPGDQVWLSAPSTHPGP